MMTSMLQEDPLLQLCEFYPLVLGHFKSFQSLLSLIAAAVMANNSTWVLTESKKDSPEGCLLLPRTAYHWPPTMGFSW